MNRLRPWAVLLLIQVAAVPLALLAAHALVKWDLWSSTAWPGELVGESVELQERVRPLLLRFTPTVGLFIWLAIGGISYAIMHRRDPIHFLSGVNLVWLPLGFTALLGVAGGLYITAHGIVQRRWLAPLLSLAANVVCLLNLCWYWWESMRVLGD